MTETPGGPDEPSAEPRRFAYQPPLDGLRALAVGVVVLYHLGYRWMRGGFMGVDAFFVLSGYLITSLLLTESAATGRIRLGGFWSRRARRLLPALVTMVVVVIVYAAWFGPGAQLDHLRGDAIASLFYVANWRLVSQLYSPFQHLWSLAVEEQFYVVWPLVVALAARMARRPWRAVLVTASLGVVAAQVFTLVVYDPKHIAPAYFSTPARMNTIFVGCALAAALLLYPRLAPDRSRRTMTVLGASALLVCGLAWVRAAPSREFFTGGDTLFALVFAVLVFSLQQPNGPVARLLAIRPLVWVGRLSYAIYLWQWPVILYVDGPRTGLTGVPLDLLRVGLTLVLAMASTRLVEQPVRRTRIPVLTWAVPATIVALVVVLVATSSVTLSASERDPLAYRLRCFRPTAADRTATREALRRAGVGSGTPLRTRSITVVGDGGACNLVAGLESAAPLVAVRAVDAVRPLCGVVAGDTRLPDRTAGAPGCLGASRSAYRGVAAPKDRVVWWSTLEGRDFVVDGRTVPAVGAEHTRILRARMEGWLRRELPAGAALTIVAVPPPTTGDVPFAARIARLDAQYRAFAGAHPGRVTLVDLGALRCDARPECVAMLDTLRNRPGVPLGPEGTALLTAWLLPRLEGGSGA